MRYGNGIIVQSVKNMPSPDLAQFCTSEQLQHSLLLWFALLLDKRSHEIKEKQENCGDLEYAITCEAPFQPL